MPTRAQLSDETHGRASVTTWQVDAICAERVEAVHPEAAAVEAVAPQVVPVQ